MESAKTPASAPRRQRRLSATLHTQRRLGTSKDANAYADSVAASIAQKPRKKSLLQRGWLADGALLCAHIAVSVAALVNVLIFPTVLAFSGEVAHDSSPGWWSLLLLLDVVLWTDVLARFATPLWDDGMLVYDHRRVAVSYLRGWFVYDLVCRLPWDVVIRGRFAFRYGHLARLLLAPRAVAFINSPLKHPHAGHSRHITPSQRLVALMFSFFVLLHWYACLLWLVGEALEADGKVSWLTLASDSAPAEWHEWPTYARYCYAFDRAALTMIGEGVRGQTYEEIALGVFGLGVGIIWLAYFTGAIVQLLGTLNQRTERALAKISSIRTFCSHAGLTPELTKKVINHLEYVLIVRKLEFDWQHLLCELSEPLRAEVSLQRCKAFLSNPKIADFFGSATSPQFIKLLVTKLKHVVFSPADFCIEEGDQGREVYFLSRGRVIIIAAQKQVASLTSGDIFGEIALLIPGTVRTASIVAAEFCEAHKLEHHEFEKCLAIAPELKAQISLLAKKRLAELNQKRAESGLKAMGPVAAPGAVAPAAAPPSGRRSSFSGLVKSVMAEQKANSDALLPATSAFALAAAEASLTSSQSASKGSSCTASRANSRRPSCTNPAEAAAAAASFAAAAAVALKVEKKKLEEEQQQGEEVSASAAPAPTINGTSNTLGFHACDAIERNNGPLVTNCRTRRTEAACQESVACQWNDASYRLVEACDPDEPAAKHLCPPLTRDVCDAEPLCSWRGRLADASGRGAGVFGEFFDRCSGHGVYAPCRLNETTAGRTTLQSNETNALQDACRGATLASACAALPECAWAQRNSDRCRCDPNWYGQTCNQQLLVHSSDVRCSVSEQLEVSSQPGTIDSSAYCKDYATSCLTYLGEDGRSIDDGKESNVSGILERVEASCGPACRDGRELNRAVNTINAYTWLGMIVEIGVSATTLGISVLCWLIATNALKKLAKLEISQVDELVIREAIACFRSPTRTKRSSTLVAATLIVEFTGMVVELYELVVNVGPLNENWLSVMAALGGAPLDGGFPCVYVNNELQRVAEAQTGDGVCPPSVLGESVFRIVSSSYPTLFVVMVGFVVCFIGCLGVTVVELMREAWKEVNPPKPTTMTRSATRWRKTGLAAATSTTKPKPLARQRSALEVGDDLQKHVDDAQEYLIGVASTLGSLGMLLVDGTRQHFLLSGRSAEMIDDLYNAQCFTIGSGSETIFEMTEELASIETLGWVQLGLEVVGVILGLLVYLNSEDTAARALGLKLVRWARALVAFGRRHVLTCCDDACGFSASTVVPHEDIAAAEEEAEVPAILAVPLPTTSRLPNRQAPTLPPIIVAGGAQSKWDTVRQAPQISLPSVRTNAFQQLALQARSQQHSGGAVHGGANGS